MVRLGRLSVVRTSVVCGALALLLCPSALRAQACDASTGVAGGTEGSACIETALVLGADSAAQTLGLVNAPMNGESLVWTSAAISPGLASAGPGVHQALALAASGGLVLATGGEFRQTLGLVRTLGFDARHPFQLAIGYRSYEVDAWRVAGDACGTIDDPFGPGWRASWGDLLVEPNTNGADVVRVDEHGVRWTHHQVSSQVVLVGPLDQPTTWRTYDAAAGTRLVLEYHVVAGQVTPIWFREWPDRTRAEYAPQAGSGADRITQRFYRGAYTTPDWQVVFEYDPTSGHLAQVTDARGIKHEFTWTTFASTRRVTKLRTTVPATWTPNWPVLETHFEYSPASPYLLTRVRRPTRAFLDDQDRNGSYEADDAFQAEVVTRFTYAASSNRIDAVFDESTGLARQMLGMTYDSATPWRVASMTEGEPSSLPGQGPRTQTLTYPQANRTVWTDPRGVQRVYDYDPSFGTSPRQWRVTRIEEIAGLNDVRPSSDPNYHASLVWQLEWACACGQLTGLTLPSGIRHVFTYDSEGRGLVTSTGVVPTGQGAAQQLRSWSYRSWNDSDYRLASRLTGYVDALGKIGSHTFALDPITGGYRIDGAFAGTARFALQEDAAGRVLWLEEAAFTVDGGGTSSARVGYGFGPSPSSPDHRLVTQVHSYAADGATIRGTRTLDYEGLGWLRSVTDELGRTTVLHHDSVGRVTSVNLPVTASGRGSATYSATVALEYDRRGQVARSSRSATDDLGAAYAHAAVTQSTVYDYFSRPWRMLTDTTPLSLSTSSSVTTVNEFDLGNRLVRVNAAGDRETAYRIDDHDQLYQRQRKLTDSTWSIEEYGYHTDGLLVRAVDPTGLLGAVDTLDAWGRPQRAHLPGEKHLFVARDAEDRIVQSEYRTGSGGTTLQNTLVAVFDDLGRLVSETLTAPGSPVTRSLTYTFNGVHRVATVLDADGRGASYGYDELGRLVRTQDRLLGSTGNAELFTRDIAGNVTRVEHLEQRQTAASSWAPVTYRIDLAYDAWDRLSHAEFWGSATAPLFTRYAGYDNLGNLTWSKDGVGKETRIAFDAVGRRTDEWFHQRDPNALAAHLTRSYVDAPSDPLLSAILIRTDAIGNASEYRYDLLGRLVERRLPGYVAGSIGKQWTYEYDLAGRPSAWRDGNGTRVQDIYDAERRLTERRVLQLPGNGVLLSPMATHETWAYDAFDRVVSAQTWWSTYPQFTGTMPPSLVEAVDSFDGIGRQTLERFRYLDDSGPGYVPLATKDLAYGYEVPGGGQDSTLRRSMSTSAGFLLGTTPDGAGKLAAMTLSGPGIPAQPLAEWRYEGNRPVRRSFLPGAVTTTELIAEFAYDALRHATQMTTTRSMSGANTVLDDLLMARDVEGNVTQHRFAKAAGGAGDWFLLDGWDRLLEAKLGVTGFSGSYASAALYDKKLSYALDAAHNRSAVDEEVGGNTATTAYTRTLGTNEYQEVTAPNGEVQGWLYDGNGNLLSDGYYLYVYDHLDRLSEVYLLTYPGGATEQTATGTVVRTFGIEPQTRRDGKETEVPVQIWREKVQRARQRVAAARTAASTAPTDPRVPLGANAGTSGAGVAGVDEAVPVLVVLYGYDPSNRRIGKFFPDLSGALYAWSGWDLAEAYDLYFQPTTVWFEGGVIDEHLGYTQRDTSGGAWTRYGYVQDHTRGINKVVDASGAVIERYEYDPYGRMTVFTASGVPNGTVPTVPGQVYGFTGRQFDPETGLMYYRHRYYQPGHGRFLTADPFGSWFDDAGHGNQYQYSGASPLARIDPLGLFTTVIVILGADQALNQINAERARYLADGDPDGGEIITLTPDKEGQLQISSVSVRFKNTARRKRNPWFDHLRARAGKRYLDVLANHGVVFEFDTKKYARLGSPDLSTTENQSNVAKILEALDTAVKRRKDRDPGKEEDEPAYHQVLVTTCFQGLGAPDSPPEGIPTRRHNVATLIADALQLPVLAYDCLIVWDNSPRPPRVWDGNTPIKKAMDESPEAAPVIVQPQRD